MKNKLLSIGQMAKMNHTTVPTLRLYDQLGLLHPHILTRKLPTVIMTSARTPVST